MACSTGTSKISIFTGSLTMNDISTDTVAAENWRRYQYGLNRGHREYTESARFLEGYYLGGTYSSDGKLQPGGHWSEADLDVLDYQKRPAYETNQTMPALNSAFGYQINNRMTSASVREQVRQLNCWPSLARKWRCRLPTTTNCTGWNPRYFRTD